MAKLHITLPDGSQTDHELTDDLVTVGRLSDNTVQIEDGSVSSHHARLVLGEGGEYVLEDLGSTNGTRLNGKPISEGQQHLLKTGAKIRFGSIEVHYGEPLAEEDAEELPEADKHVQKPASRSVKPSNFMNASPFEKKSAKKDNAGVAVWIAAGVALVAFLGAALMALGVSAS